MLKTNIISLLLLALFCKPVLAQMKSLKFQQIEALNGIAPGSIYKITQDKSDFIWLGTSEGLIKYDGYSYKFYKHEALNPNSLPENWVLDIIEDKNGDLWIGTQGGGLSKFNIKTETFKNFQYKKEAKINLISSNIIRSLFIDKEEKLWVGSQNGLSIIDLKTEKKVELCSQLKSVHGFAQGSINSICESEGYLYFGCWGDGLLTLNPKTLETEVYQTRSSETNWLKENKVKTVKADANGLIWIGTRGGGLNIFDPKSKTFTVINNDAEKALSISSNSIQSLLVDSRGNVWAGMFDNGLSYLNLQKKSVHTFTRNVFDVHSIPSNWIASIFEDHSGLIWIGTDRGLAKIPVWEPNFQHIGLSSGASGEFNINAILQDRKGNFWFGTWGGGLVKYDIKTNTIKTFLKNESKPNTISNNNVWELKEDKDGKIWVGTGDGLDCLDPVTDLVCLKIKNDLKNNNSLIHNNVSALLFDSKNRIWVGSWGEGLTVIDSSRKNFQRFNNDETKSRSISDDFINSIFEDSKHRIWIATAKEGLNLYDGKNGFTVFKNDLKNKNSIPNNNIEEICEDKQGRIWLGTNGNGIVCFYPEKYKFESFTQKNGISSDIVHRILVDKDDNLWISTSNGISFFNQKTKQFKCFYEDDGLQGNEFNRGAFLCSDGQMLFGGSNGVSMFNPNKIVINQHVPKLAITGFKKFNTEYPLEQFMKNGTLELSYKDEVISFEFAALDFLLPEKNHYLYKMEGLDTAWTDAGFRRFTTYTYLHPGNYVFRVKACNKNGVWNEKGIALKIKIAPPFWETWWFYSICLLFILQMIVVYNRSRVHKFEKDQRKLEEKVNEKTSELLHQKNIVEEKNLQILFQKEEIEKQKLAVEEQRDFVTQQRDLIIQQNTELTDSIIYAKRIQTALMNKETEFAGISSEYFIYFKPREIVSGDFYLFVQKGNLSYIAVADCTGHGIPGAFMSVLGISSLNEIINQKLETNAAKVLEKLKAKVIQSLHQTGQIYEAKDGMDIAFCIIDHLKRKISYSGANHPLYLIRRGELMITKGDPIPIGIYFKEMPFINHVVDLEEGDLIYLFTDGYMDQFGGEKGRKFMLKTFRELLVANSHLPMDEQKSVFIKAFYEWKGAMPQIDDILILGFKFQC